MKKLILIFIMYTLLFNCNAQVKDIDGNTYETKTYGNTTFFTDYLRTTRYNDGTEIPNVTNQDEWRNLTTGAQCDFENNPGNSDKYGKLYNFYAIETNKLCPLGWHVFPQKDEACVLRDSVWMLDTNFRRYIQRNEFGDFNESFGFWWDGDFSTGNYNGKIGATVLCFKDPIFAKITASKTTICPNETTELTAETFSGSKPYEYLWLPDSLTTKTITVSPQQHTIYTLRIKDINGYINYVNYDIWVLAKPTANFSFNYNLNNSNIDFQNTSLEVVYNDGTRLSNSYIWDFEDENKKINVTTEQPISYNFETIGIHSVTLYAISETGCKDSITKIIDTKEFPYISVPSAFSPNNDGLNDELYAVGRNIEDVTFMIYDRWGQKVFETNNLQEGWDGTFNGIALEPATYMYYISAIATYDGKKIERKGDITLIK